MRRRTPSDADGTPGGPTSAAYLVPSVPEVATLAGAAERVLVACGHAERDHGELAARWAAAVDPGTLPVRAVVGPGLPVPLSGGVALDALRRVTDALFPATATWRTGTGRRLPAFRALRVDTTDLAVLGMAAAQLTPPRPAEGALGAALDAVTEGGGEPPDDRHPAALGCLLAVLVPVIDPAVVTLHGIAVRGGDATLSEAEVGAHREVVCRVLARLRRAR